MNGKKQNERTGKRDPSLPASPGGGQGGLQKSGPAARGSDSENEAGPGRGAAGRPDGGTDRQVRGEEPDLRGPGSEPLRDRGEPGGGPGEQTVTRRRGAARDDYEDLIEEYN